MGRARPFPIRVLFVVLSLLLTPEEVRPQSTRVEQIAQEQAEKAMRLAPEEAGLGETLVVRVLSSPLMTGAGGAYPWFGSVYSGTGFALGGGYLRRLSHRGSASLRGGASINGSLLADADWRIPLPERARVRPRLNARWVDAKGLSFYGTGSRTEPAQEMEFDYQPRRVQGSIDADLSRWLTVAAEYGYLGISTTAGPGHTVSPAAGLGESLHFITSGAGIAADWRTSPGYSTNGGLVRVGWNRYDARDDEPYTYDSVEFEAVQLVPLAGEQYVLAFRVLATTTAASQGDDVAFPLLPTLGGGDTLRGYFNRRLTDRSRALATAEYRWRPSRYLDMALFIDSGTVAPRLRDLGDQRLATAWGIGGRLHGPTFTALRIEASRGREGWRVVFAGGQPF